MFYVDNTSCVQLCLWFTFPEDTQKHKEETYIVYRGRFNDSFTKILKITSVRILLCTCKVHLHKLKYDSINSNKIQCIYKYITYVYM